MDLSAFEGIFPAGMTFFDAAGDLDERATLDHWHHLVDQGVHGLVIAGTSGEFISLTIEERLRLFELAAEQFGGKLPLIAGSGHSSTKLTIEISQQAERFGMDALIVILPYYCRPPIPAVIDHYRALRHKTQRPIMLYNNPANTACPALTPVQISELVRDDVVQMVKSTMESVVPIHDLSLLVGDLMRTFYGSFLSAYEAFTAGAHGWISGVLNIAAKKAIAMHQAIANRQDMVAAFDCWKEILPLVHLYTYAKLGPVSDISIYRGILQLQGRHGGYSRLPFAPLSGKQLDKLAETLAPTGWLEASE